MGDVATEVYSVQPLTDGPGTGLRMVDANDALYELRNFDGFHTRIYGDGDGFTAKVRKPVDADAATDIFPEVRALAAQVEDEYGVAFQPDARRFYEHVEERGTSYTRAGGAHTLRYNPEPRTDSLPSTAPDQKRGTIALYGSLAPWAAAMFGAPDPAAGLAIGLGGGAYLMWETIGLGSGGRLPSPAISLLKRYKERRLEGHKAGTHLTDDLVEDVNTLTVRKAEVEALLDREARYDDIEDVEREKELEAERRELLDSDTWDAFERQLDINFHAFEELDGITTTYECGSYTGAATFVSTVTGEDLPAERTSLYTDPARFEDIFEALPEDDKRTLLGNVIAADPSEAVEAVAEDHTDLLQEAGREHTLHSTDSGHTPELTYETLDTADEEDAITFIADDMDIDRTEAERFYRRYLHTHT